MNNLAFIPLFLCLILTGCRQENIIEYRIIPEPVQITYSNGAFKMGNELQVGYAPELAGEAKLLENWFAKDFNLNINLLEGKNKADLWLVLDQSLTVSPEAYVLEIGKKRITIRANAPNGILHGIQTLRQIIRKDENRWMVQNGTITDEPAMEWRAFMLDEGRYFKGKDVVFRLLDEMSRLKMNIFHWHLTDDQGWRIEIKKYPELTVTGAFRDSSEINHFHSNIYDGKPHGGFYTQDDIREVVSYATDRHITIVPEIEMPGHASAAIASYPWLGTSGKQIRVPGQFGVHYDIFNVADPRVLKFFEDVAEEVIALFPGPVFHIGGDEVKYNQWKESPMVQQYMKEHQLKTPAELQVFFTNNMSNILATKNRRMMGWNEITGAKLHEYQSAEDTKNTEARQQLNPRTIVHFWKGDSALIRQTVEKGYDIVNSYHIFTYLDYSYKSISLKKAYTFNPIPAGLTPEQQKHVLGLGCQMWGEFIPTVEQMNLKIFPRIAAYAENGWTLPEKKDYDRFVLSLDSFLDRWKEEGIGYGDWKAEN